MKKKSKSHITIVNLSTYNSPDIKVVKNKDYVTYGDNNSYFQYLIDRYTESPTNNAIINGISQMIFGRGLAATDSNKKPEEYAKMMTLFTDDVVRKFAYDLKLAGQCAIQVIYSKDRKSVAEVAHIPVETLAMEKCNEEGEIEGFYYCSDWANKKANEELQRIPAFGTSKESLEILYIKPYAAGYYYYPPVDYQGGLQYAELEGEVSNFHLNNIQNGLAPSMLINFSNGIPDEETRRRIENSIQQKWGGSSNAGRFILNFSDSKEEAAEIQPVELSDAHNQYEFLSNESMRKIMVAHRVVSPMLLGIKDNTGLGNNADELRQASILMDNLVIRPFQKLLIDGFTKILSYNNVSLNIYFKTLQPLEFVDLENAQNKEQVEEETGEKKEFSKDDIDLTSNEQMNVLENLIPEAIGEEWELVEKREFGIDDISIEDWANKVIEPKQTALQKLADYIKTKPSGFSYLDKSYYKVRYEYSERHSSTNSRTFCKVMMRRTKKGNVYRLEDIDKASREGVNRKFGHKGKPYDLFKYKGGVSCGHYWSQVLYRLKDKTKVGSDKLYDYKETNDIPKSYIKKPLGTKESKIAPKDMKDNGHHPNYVAKQKNK